MRENYTSQEIAAAIVDTRTFRIADIDKRTSWDNGGYRQLHAHFWIPTAVYEALFWHEKRTAHAIAVGKSSHSSVLVGRSAGRVSGMWVVTLSTETVELSNPLGHVPARNKRQPGVSYHGFRLLPGDYGVVAGVRATTPPRTAVDIARLHQFREGLVACDWALAHGFTVADLEFAARALGRVRGIGHVRRAIQHTSSLSDSPFESLLRGVLIDEGLTDFRLQAQIGPYFVDILLFRFLVIEVDGAAKYKDDAELADVQRKEMAREKYIRNLGYWVLRFTPEEIFKQPEMVIHRIREALAEHQRIGKPQPRAT